VHHLLIEKEFKKMRHKNSTHDASEVVYLNVNNLHAKSAKSSGGNAAATINRIDKLVVNGYVEGQVTGYETIEKPTIKSKFIRVHIDVSVEKLQQNLQGHLLTLNIKNLHVEPLMEINHIKAKLSYFKIELVNNDNDTGNSSAAAATTEAGAAAAVGGAKFTSNARTFVKINRFKEKKCKFDRNLKNFARPIDFELSKDHFIFVSEEAVRAQMKKLNIRMDNELDDDGVTDRTVYLFLFWIELHSYLPVSRKTLSSTFRKQKRVFKGECQIVENFINMTQFPKTFIANEV
jgi:hypothetical protein